MPQPSPVFVGTEQFVRLTSPLVSPQAFADLQALEAEFLPGTSEGKLAILAEGGSYSLVKSDGQAWEPEGGEGFGPQVVIVQDTQSIPDADEYDPYSILVIDTEGDEPGDGYYVAIELGEEVVWAALNLLALDRSVIVGGQSALPAGLFLVPGLSTLRRNATLYTWVMIETVGYWLPQMDPLGSGLSVLVRDLPASEVATWGPVTVSDGTFLGELEDVGGWRVTPGNDLGASAQLEGEYVEYRADSQWVTGAAGKISLTMGLLPLSVSINMLEALYLRCRFRIEADPYIGASVSLAFWDPGETNALYPVLSYSQIPGEDPESMTATYLNRLISTIPLGLPAGYFHRGSPDVADFSAEEDVLLEVLLLPQESRYEVYVNGSPFSRFGPVPPTGLPIHEASMVSTSSLVIAVEAPYNEIGEGSVAARFTDVLILRSGSV